MQFQGKLIIQTQENGNKPHFGPNLSPLVPNLGHQIFLFQNLALSVTRYQCDLSICTISDKTNNQILRKFSEEQMDKQMDHQTKVIS